jgi:hypothetical protein
MTFAEGQTRRPEERMRGRYSTGQDHLPGIDAHALQGWYAEGQALRPQHARRGQYSTAEPRPPARRR